MTWSLQSLGAILVIALMSTAIEAISPHGWDNATMQLVPALLAAHLIWKSRRDARICPHPVIIIFALEATNDVLNRPFKAGTILLDYFLKRTGFTETDKFAVITAPCGHHINLCGQLCDGPIRCCLLFEAATFVVASLIHSGVLIAGYEHQKARIAEGVIAIVLLAAAASDLDPAGVDTLRRD